MSIVRLARVAILLLAAGAAAPSEGVAQSSQNAPGFRSVLDEPATGSAQASPTLPIPPIVTIDELVASRPPSPPVNAGLIFQAGNSNFASQAVIGIANQVIQVQKGNNNVSTVTELATRNTSVGVFQEGNDLESHILMLGNTGTTVLHLQQGNGDSTPIMVIGDRGVVVGNRFVPNTSGRPITSVIVRNRP